MKFKGHMRPNESDPGMLMLTMFLDAINAMELWEGVFPITQTLIPPRRLQRMSFVECNRFWRLCQLQSIYTKFLRASLGLHSS